MRFLILHAVSIGLIPLGWLLARALAGDITGSDRYGNHYEHAAPAFWVTTSLFVILQAVLSYIRTHKVTLNAFGYFFSHLAIAMLTTGWFMAAIKIGPPPIALSWLVLITGLVFFYLTYLYTVKQSLLRMTVSNLWCGFLTLFFLLTLTEVNCYPDLCGL